MKIENIGEHILSALRRTHLASFHFSLLFRRGKHMLFHGGVSQRIMSDDVHRLNESLVFHSPTLTLHTDAIELNRTEKYLNKKDEHTHDPLDITK